MNPVCVNGIGLWTPGYASPSAWSRGERDSGVVDPPRRLLKSRIGRFTSLVTRIAVAVLEQAAAQSAADPGTMPTVFGSAHGEIQIAFEQLDMIEREGVPSPARFKNSVHNTASGHVSIATGNTGFTTALAAGLDTFAMSMLEAWAWLECHEGSVLVAVADEPLPDHLSSVARFEPLGIALNLGADPSEQHTLGYLQQLRRGGRVPLGTRIPEELARNPTAAGLPLVDAVVQGRQGKIPLALEGGWSVEFQPRDSPQ